MKYGRYQIDDEIGRGSMGVVYKAYDPKIDRPIAIKVLRKDLLANQELVQRFLMEALAIGRIPHPNIVTVHDAGEDQGTVFIAMELLMGQSLRDIMRKSELSLQEIITIGVEVAKALDFSHQRGIVHRDIKPSNIIRDTSGHIKITDFGIAHIEDPALPQQTIAGEILGTPLYMSPEQVMSKPVDGRSDIYSLGVVLYELIAGTNPFKGEGLPAIFNSIKQDMPPKPHISDTDISRPLTELIMKSISKDPNHRFQRGKAMAQALTKCRRGRKSDPIPVSPTTPITKRRRLFALGIVSVLAMACIIMWLIILPDGIPPHPKSVLKIESNPLGANFFLNGTLEGKTPLQINLPFGKYEVRLSLQNYYDWEAQLQLDKDVEMPLFVELTPMDEIKP